MSTTLQKLLNMCSGQYAVMVLHYIPNLHPWPALSIWRTQATLWAVLLVYHISTNHLQWLRQCPDGLFKSKFVVKIMTIFIGSIKGSMNHKEGFLQGAMGMTAIAVSVKHLILHYRLTKSQIAWAHIHCLSFQNEISTWPVLAKELWI